MWDIVKRNDIFNSPMRSLREFSKLDNLLDSEWRTGGLFDSFFREFDVMFGDAKYVNGNILTYEIEVPGFNKDNINITVDKGILSVVGERDIEGSHAGKKYVNKQLNIGDIDIDKIDAEIKDGILFIKIECFENIETVEEEPKEIKIN